MVCLVDVRASRLLPDFVGRGKSAVPAITQLFILLLMSCGLCRGERLTPDRALERYLERRRYEQTSCPESLFAVQIDASVPALKKRGSMTGFKWIGQPGHIVYRGLRFTGDNVIKTQVIARFLARETNPPRQTEDVSVTPANYALVFERVSDYNGLAAYVFLLKPHRKRAGLVRGELWLDAETAAPLRPWGDLVQSPSIFVRNLRLVEDYQSVAECAEPLRLLFTMRTRIAGVEMTVWQRPADFGLEYFLTIFEKSN